MVLLSIIPRTINTPVRKGHAKVGGGRVPAQVHIRPVEEYVIDELPRRIERAVQQ